MVTRLRTFRVFRGTDGVGEALGPAVVAFGKFDGVHLGHRALLARAVAAGRRLGLPAGAVTFDRHPHAHLRGGGLPPALTGLAERLRLLRDAGAAFVVLLPTDATVLGLSAEDFARDVLRDRMRVRLVVVGQNFRFGRGGAGDVGTLRRLVSVTGLDAVEMAMTAVDGEAVSATAVRGHLARGDVRRAGQLLGRPYDVLGSPAVRRPGLIRVPAARAVPAPGSYRASVRPVRAGGEPVSVALTVLPGRDGPHQLEVERPDGGTRHAFGGGPVRVAFEARNSDPEAAAVG